MKKSDFFSQDLRSSNRLLSLNTGNTIDIVADSVCVHGDNPEAIAFTNYIREGLTKAGVTVANFQNRK